MSNSWRTGAKKPEMGNSFRGRARRGAPVGTGPALRRGALCGRTRPPSKESPKRDWVQLLLVRSLQSEWNKDGGNGGSSLAEGKKKKLKLQQRGKKGSFA